MNSIAGLLISNSGRPVDSGAGGAVEDEAV